MAVERIYYDEIKELEEQLLIFKNLRKQDTKSLISLNAENKQLKEELADMRVALDWYKGAYETRKKKYDILKNTKHSKCSEGKP